ncbi:hypothetical protein ACIBEA_41435 [Streptomyces sp. NPDC051555]|uniref:hypothetical protein n=1 Tax=Streptomyces sp. NPDC051555 TaxID=3365657 RepID=UPI0037A42550
MHELGATTAIEALARLTGQAPETAEHDGVVTIRADTSQVPAEHWQRLVAVLETGTSYGMNSTAAGTSTVWLRIEPGDPRS